MCVFAGRGQDQVPQSAAAGRLPSDEYGPFADTTERQAGAGLPYRRAHQSLLTDGEAMAKSASDIGIVSGDGAMTTPT